MKRFVVYINEKIAKETDDIQEAISFYSTLNNYNTAGHIYDREGKHNVAERKAANDRNTAKLEE